ncbi:MAG: HlyC/CorC family transporter, partial [Clostridia bacterium]|nr:HlyC/CorC family transporter [Clostridia bacterium]
DGFLMDDSPAGSIILFIVLLIFSAYFSGTETSLASVNRIHMISKSGSGNKGASRVLYVLENFEEALSVLLIGNNIVNIGCATISAVIATKVLKTNAITFSTVFTTAVIFLFGEMLPKTFARSCNERFAELSSGVLIFLMRILKPLSVFFTAISKAVSKPFARYSKTKVTMTEDELHTIVDNISKESGIDEDTGRLVKSALEFSEAAASEIMVPWEQVLKIKQSMKTPEILEVIKNTKHSRIPVIDRSGRVKGILQIRKFLKAYLAKKNNVILASVTDYPYFIKPDTLIDDLLSAMSNHRKNLAFVRDEKGEVLGIVTIEDILEQLVGEIYDEDDIAAGGDANE